MKKAILLSIFLLFPNIALGSDLGTGNFYSSISNSIDSIENNMYSVELIGKSGTKDKINSILADIGTKGTEACIQDNLSSGEIEAVINDGNLSIIINKISPQCKNGDTVSIQNATDIFRAIETLHNESLAKGINKANQIINLDSTGVYSDGIEGNAPFDLIIDLKSIDEILFDAGDEEYYEYDGNTTINLGDKLSGLLREANNLNTSATSSPSSGIQDLLDPNLNWGINEFYYPNLKEYNNRNSVSVENSYMCAQGSSDSGLSSNAIDDLLGRDSNSSSSGTTTDYLSSNNSSEFYLPPINSGLEIVNDNSEFPCTDFFCIDISFDTYNHKMLGSWSAFNNPSIEYLINRSNEHLKKFANASLLQSKMSINNFELGLKDFNLAELFHFGIVVDSKPIPILDLKNEKANEDKDSGKYDDLENQLDFYYSSYSLDSTRRNDLSLLNKIDVERQISTNSALLSPNEYASKFRDYDEYEREKAYGRQYLQNILENNTKIEILRDFEKQFRELEIFNGSIKEYANNIASIVNGMLKIPVDSGKT